MLATRPLVLVVSILPVLAAVVPAARIAKHHRFEFAYEIGLALLACGAVAGIVGAIQFGNGVPTPPARRHAEEDDD